MSETQTAVSKVSDAALILSAPIDHFQTTSMQDVSEAINRAKEAGKLKDGTVTSINMVDTYLSFDNLQDTPIRRYFAGWTARPLLDYKTKEPITDPETGEQMYGPAAILYDDEKEIMEVNMAFDLVSTIKKRRFLPGQGLQITFKGMKKTSKGNNKQVFDIRLLDHEAGNN